MSGIKVAGPYLSSTKVKKLFAQNAIAHLSILPSRKNNITRVVVTSMQKSICAQSVTVIHMPNKKIKSFATAHWDAQKAARPLFKR